MFVCYSKTLSYFCPPAGTDDGFPTPDDVEIKHYCHETYFYQNQNVGSTDVTLTPEYIESATGYTTRLQISGASEAGDDVRENGGIPMWGKVLLCAGAACVILAVILTLILVRIRRRRKQRRMRRRRQQIKEMRGRGGKRRRYTGRRRG